VVLERKGGRGKNGGGKKKRRGGISAARITKNLQREGAAVAQLGKKTPDSFISEEQRKNPLYQRRGGQSEASSREKWEGKTRRGEGYRMEGRVILAVARG